MTDLVNSWSQYPYGWLIPSVTGWMRDQIKVGSGVSEQLKMLYDDKAWSHNFTRGYNGNISITCRSHVLMWICNSASKLIQWWFSLTQISTNLLMSISADYNIYQHVHILCISAWIWTKLYDITYFEKQQESLCFLKMCIKMEREAVHEIFHEMDFARRLFCRLF